MLYNPLMLSSQKLVTTYQTYSNSGGGTYTIGNNTPDRIIVIVADWDSIGTTVSTVGALSLGGVVATQRVLNNQAGGGAGIWTVKVAGTSLALSTSILNVDDFSIAFYTVNGGNGLVNIVDSGQSGTGGASSRSLSLNVRANGTAIWGAVAVPASNGASVTTSNSSLITDLEYGYDYTGRGYYHSKPEVSGAINPTFSYGNAGQNALVTGISLSPF